MTVKTEGLVDLTRANSMPMIKRHGGDLTLTDPVAGLYNTWLDNANPLFDVCVPDALVALCWQDQLHPIFDILGFRTSDLYQYEQGYITYVAPDGSAAGTPSSGILTDPCEPGEGTEFGSAVCRVDGWTQFKRSSDTFDIRQLGMRLCDKSPIHTIDGERIDDDYDWAVMQLMMVQLQDVHTWLIDGAVGVNQTDGLYNLINGTAIDANTTNNIPALANYVIDWNGSQMLDSVGATATGQRAFAIPDGTTFWSVMRDWLSANLFPRLQWSSLPVNRGFEVHFLVDHRLLSCLIESWICESICGGDPTTETARQVLDTMEARAMRDRMRRFLNAGAVPFDVDGYRLWFHGYPYGTSLVNVDGTFNMIGFVQNVGGQQTLQLDVNDMSKVNSIPKVMSGDYLVSDGGRVLSYETLDHTCIRYHSQMDMRLGLCNKWMTIKFENIACDNLFGYSKNPLSDLFLGTGAVDTVEYQPATAQPVD